MRIPLRNSRRKMVRSPGRSMTQRKRWYSCWLSARGSGSGTCRKWRRRTGFSGFSVFTFITALSSLSVGLRDLWIYKRCLSGDYHPDEGYAKGDLSIYKTALEPRYRVSNNIVEGSQENDATKTSLPSITENTTELLERGNSSIKEEPI
jgi:hypothetical protein